MVSRYEGYRHRAPHPRANVVHPQGRPLTPEDTEARVAADQARIRAERERWLEIEREKYGLPKRGPMIDDMPA